MNKAIFILILLFFSALFAAPPKAVDTLKPLKETLSRIQKSNFVEFRLDKKVLSETLGTEKTYEGRAFLAGNLFRFETQKPEKSLIVYDGTYIWIVNYPPESPVQVMKGKLKGRQKDQMLLTELLSKGKLLDSFDVQKTAEKDGLFSYEGKAKSKEMNVQAVKVQVQGKELKQLEYVDEIGNKTTMVIKEQKHQIDPRAEIFKYRPEKGAQVQEI